MHVVVVGAGVIGITSAYYLQKHGCRVTVIDQAEGAARGCSHANGGFYTAGLSAPWSAPGAVSMAIRAQFDSSATFTWRPDGSIDQWRWLAQSMRECRPARFARNRDRLTRMAMYALQCLHEIEAVESIAYDRGTGGILQIHRNPVGKAQIDAHVRHLSAMGIPFSLLTPREVFELEPALAVSCPNLHGGLHLPDDTSGDCDSFTRALARRVEVCGAKFLWNTRIDRIDTYNSGGRRWVRALVADRARIHADAFVFATGAHSAGLLKGVVKVPVYPIKGYSMTGTITDERLAPQRSIFDHTAKMGMARLGDRVRVSGIAEIVGYGTRRSHARCEQLRDTFAAVFPRAIRQDEVTFWTGLRPATPDGVPRVGRTAYENLFLNTGHGGSGWSMSCGSGRLLADIVSGHRPALDPDDYALGTQH